MWWRAVRAGRPAVWRAGARPSRTTALVSDVRWVISLLVPPGGAIMPNVAEIIKDHVTLEVRCLDRLYLNAYIPRLQSSGGVIDFLVRACGQKIASPAIFGHLTDAFKTRLRRGGHGHSVFLHGFLENASQGTNVPRRSGRLSQS